MAAAGARMAQLTAAVKEATGAKGRALFLPLRRALTGRDHGPDMAELLPFDHTPLDWGERKR